MDSLTRDFRLHCTRTRLIPPRGRILVALSGGLDSMTLLDLVRTAFPHAAVAAAHFDHAWRPDSASDAAWVARTCRDLGITFYSERAEKTPAGEAAARAARYAFLERVAGEWAADRILTGHHADDQAETILFRIARGTGTRGLSGIPARRGLIARPLLTFRRADLETHGEARGLKWREDATNLDERFARNRIRRSLIPALEHASPGQTERILEIGRLAAEAESCWRQELRDVLEAAVITHDERRFTLASHVLRGYHPTVLARVIRTLAARLGTVLQRSAARRAAAFVAGGRSGSGIELGDGLSLARELDTLILGRDSSIAVDRSMGRWPGDDVQVAIDSPADGSAEAVIGGRRVRVRWEMDAAENGNGVAFDLRQVRFPLVLRGWLPGDRIRLSCGSKKLKKLFVERRVERSCRSSVPVLAESGDGRVLWLPGIARAAGGDPVSGSPVFCIRLEA